MRAEEGQEEEPDCVEFGASEGQRWSLSLIATRTWYWERSSQLATSFVAMDLQLHHKRGRAEVHADPFETTIGESVAVPMRVSQVEHGGGYYPP